MADARTDVILATGGVAVVRAAYRSGNPAIGVGPGNAPVFVDATADLPRRPSASSPASPSTIRSSAPTSPCWWRRRRSPTSWSAICRTKAPISATRTNASGCAATCFPRASSTSAALGKDASLDRRRRRVCARRRARRSCWRRSSWRCRKSRSRARSCAPCSASSACPTPSAASTSAAPCMRIAGSGHSAAIHSRDPKTIMAFAAAVQALRVAVNAACSTGAAGFDTQSGALDDHRHRLCRPQLRSATTSGRSISCNWARIAYDKDAAEKFGDFDGHRALGHARRGWRRRSHRADGRRRTATSAPPCARRSAR